VLCGAFFWDHKSDSKVSKGDYGDRCAWEGLKGEGSGGLVLKGFHRGRKKGVKVCMGERPGWKKMERAGGWVEAF